MRQPAAHQPIRWSNHHLPEACLRAVWLLSRAQGISHRLTSSSVVCSSLYLQSIFHAQIPNQPESGIHLLKRRKQHCRSRKLSAGQGTCVSSDEGFIFGSKGYVAGIPTSPATADCGQRLQACLKHRYHPLTLQTCYHIDLLTPCQACSTRVHALSGVHAWHLCVPQSFCITCAREQSG